MEYKIICVALILFAVGAIAGCETKSDLSKPDSSNVAHKSAEMASNGLPADWTNTITLSKTESPEGVLTVTLTGKNQSFNSIVDKIRSNVPKPINFREEVDPDQVLSAFEFKTDEGSWKDLLTLVAEKFDCVIEETDSEFLVVPRK